MIWKLKEEFDEKILRPYFELVPRYIDMWLDFYPSFLDTLDSYSNLNISKKWNYT